MKPEMLVLLAADGTVISAEEGYKPSSEMKMHLRCYSEREDVNAVYMRIRPLLPAMLPWGRRWTDII